MNRLSIDRRELLKLGISSSVLAAMPFGGVVLADDVADKLLEYVGNSDLPVDGARTGVLSDTDFRVLSSLCRYVDQAWQLDSKLNRYLDRLQRDLEIKANVVPSYLTEYRNAVDLYNSVLGNSNSVEQAWSNLLFAAFDVDNFSGTRLGRARYFVFAEIITHQIALSAAFRSFGLSNYTGYSAGPYMDAGSYKRGFV